MYFPIMRFEVVKIHFLYNNLTMSFNHMKKVKKGTGSEERSENESYISFGSLQFCSVLVSISSLFFFCFFVF